MSMAGNQPTGADYAHAAARAAQTTANEAKAREIKNAEAIDYIRKRQAILEEHLGLVDTISEELERRDQEARRIAIPAHMIGDTVIPEGYKGHVEGDRVVFYPVD